LPPKIFPIHPQGEKTWRAGGKGWGWGEETGGGGGGGREATEGHVIELLSSFDFVLCASEAADAAAEEGKKKKKKKKSSDGIGPRRIILLQS
jgi:hypothetical protein